MKIASAISIAAVSLLCCARTSPDASPRVVDKGPEAAVATAAPSTSSALPIPPAEATPPAEPPYDLEADLAMRKKDLGDTFGDKTKFDIVEQAFLVTVPSGVMRSSATVSRTALKAYFNNRFAAKPKKAVTVLLFDTAAPYEAYCEHSFGAPCTTPYGFYDSPSRTVVLNAGPGIGTLTHELVHPIVEADFPAAPDWINEGIASLYEAFAFPKPGEIRGNKNFRHPRLLEALKSETERKFASLPRLFAMGDSEFRGKREDLNYATARYFCMWMDRQKKLWPFYQAWRDGAKTDPTGEKAFAATMGQTPAELDATWAEWVRKL